MLHTLPPFSEKLFSFTLLISWKPQFHTSAFFPTAKQLENRSSMFFFRTGFQLVRTFPHWFPTVWAATIVKHASSRAAFPHWFPTSCSALVSHYHTGFTLETHSEAMRRKNSHHLAVSHWWIFISHYILVGKSGVSWKPPISH